MNINNQKTLHYFGPLALCTTLRDRDCRSQTFVLFSAGLVLCMKSLVFVGFCWTIFVGFTLRYWTNSAIKWTTSLGLSIVDSGGSASRLLWKTETGAFAFKIYFWEFLGIRISNSNMKTLYRELLRSSRSIFRKIMFIGP